MPARHLIDLEPVPEHAFLVAVDTSEDAGWSAVDNAAIDLARTLTA